MEALMIDHDKMNKMISDMMNSESFKASVNMIMQRRSRKKRAKKKQRQFLYECYEKGKENMTEKQRQEWLNTLEEKDDMKND
jgi:hypothetical protein